MWVVSPFIVNLEEIGYLSKINKTHRGLEHFIYKSCVCISTRGVMLDASVIGDAGFGKPSL